MSHRLQILLDEERYQRVAAKAKKERLSIAAVIRDAIDESVGDDLRAKKLAAWERLKELQAEPFDWPEDYDVMEEIRQSREEHARAYD